MSLQVFLQARLLGAEQFLSASAAVPDTQGLDFLGRAAWLTLACEAIPRALLSHLRLSRMLLGASSADQFLLVLAEEDIPRANDFLSAVAHSIARLSDGDLRLIWAATENLGAWQVARKRLTDALDERRSARGVAGAFQVFAPVKRAGFSEFAEAIVGAQQIGWNGNAPLLLTTGEDAEFRWNLVESADPASDAVDIPRRYATDATDGRPASLPELGARAAGSKRWGILRGNVDQFEARLLTAATIEEHIHLSVLFKRFFASETALLCAMPEFWRKVSLAHVAGEGFVVVGAWDALILFAHELHRVFDKFVQQNAQLLAGVEARTLSMAVALAPEAESEAADVFADAGVGLRSVKVNDPGAFFVFGRTLEWERLADAQELKVSLLRLARDFRAGGDFIRDLASVYRESFATRSTRRNKAVKVEKPWRTYMRVSQVLPEARGKEFNNVRNTILTHLLGKRTAGLKLRPSARVGLEWARLAVLED